MLYLCIDYDFGVKLLGESEVEDFAKSLDNRVIRIDGTTVEASYYNCDTDGSITWKLINNVESQ